MHGVLPVLLLVGLSNVLKHSAYKLLLLAELSVESLFRDAENFTDVINADTAYAVFQEL